MKLWPFAKDSGGVPDTPQHPKDHRDPSSDDNVVVKVLPVVLSGRDTRIRSWSGRAVQTLAAVGGYAFAGGTVGLLILARDHIFPGLEEVFSRYPTAHELLDHIGSAFIVSAIVVLIYEWGSETKHSLDLAGALAHALNKHIETILNASSHQAIANSMRQIAGPESSAFALQLMKFATAIRTLSEKEKDWAAPGYRDFIRWYHEQLTRYAHELADLSTNLRNDAESRTEFRFVLPDATDVADVMLESVTKVMGTAGKYYAISNAFTWTKLTRFRSAQQTAIKNGLHVERIFIVGTQPDETVDLSLAMKVFLGHHKDAAGAPEHYKIKLIDQGEFERRAPELRHRHHFGIFKPKDPAQTPVIFQVLDNALTQFVMTGAAEASPVLKAFEELWDDLPLELTAASGQEIVWDHFLAFRMRKLRTAVVRAVLPIGVKEAASVTSPPHPEGSAATPSPTPAVQWWPREFDKATIDPALAKEVVVHRLFVLDSTTELAQKDVRLLLQRHYFRWKHSKDHYEWRVCLRADLPESIRDEVPFVLISEPHRDRSESGVEVSLQNQPESFDKRSEKSELLGDGFDAAWQRAGSLEASVKKAFAANPADAVKLLAFMEGDHGPVAPPDHKTD